MHRRCQSIVSKPAKALHVPSNALDAYALDAYAHAKQATLSMFLNAPPRKLQMTNNDTNAKQRYPCPPLATTTTQLPGSSYNTNKLRHEAQRRVACSQVMGFLSRPCCITMIPSKNPSSSRNSDNISAIFGIRSAMWPLVL